MNQNKTYLGDSVYASFDGFSYTLTTENGYSDDPRNVIVLEPEVLHSLMKFVEVIRNPLMTIPENPLPSQFVNSVKRAMDYTSESGKTLAAGFAHLAKVDPKTSESCALNPFGGTFWFTTRNRDDVVELMRLAPKWDKSAHETGIDYDAFVDGVYFKIRTLDGALPPTCRLVEKVVEVPETIIPAHTSKKMVVECSKLQETEAESITT